MIPNLEDPSQLQYAYKIDNFRENREREKRERERERERAGQNGTFPSCCQLPLGRLLLLLLSRIFQKRAGGVPGIFSNSLRNRGLVIQQKQTG